MLVKHSAHFSKLMLLAPGKMQNKAQQPEQGPVPSVRAVLLCMTLDSHFSMQKYTQNPRNKTPVGGDKKGPKPPKTVAVRCDVM